jgi:hypothetical protein
MAVMSSAQLREVWAAFMETVSRNESRMAIGNISKSDLRAAIDAADVELDGTTTAFNDSLPAKAKSSLTAAATALIRKMVTDKRHEVGA